MSTTTRSPGRGKGPRAAEACPPTPAPISLIVLAGVTPLAADHTRSAAVAGAQPVWAGRPTRRFLEPMLPLDAPNGLTPGAEVMIWRNVACSLPSICEPA